MFTVDARPGDYLAIGRVGEHKARRVRFDLAPWVDLYGQGTAQLLYRRPGDTAPYPVALERDGDTVIWVITSTDTAQPGRTGRAELRYYVQDTLVKSAISLVAVAPALTVPDEIPEPPGQSWLDQALAAGNKAEAAAEGAGKQPKPSDHNTWLVWDTESGMYVDTGVSASGGGTNVQSDWNVSDETDPAYIQNRTHWVEPTELYSNYAIEVNSVGVAGLVVPEGTSLGQGNSLTVKMDDEDAITGTLISFDSVDGLFLSFGATSMEGLQEDLMERGWGVAVSAGAFVVYAEPNSQHTISLTAGTTVKLPSKFIPWDSAPEPNLAYYMPTKTSEWTNEILDEARSALVAGKEVYHRSEDDFLARILSISKDDIDSVQILESTERKIYRLWSSGGEWFWSTLYTAGDGITITDDGKISADKAVVYVNVGSESGTSSSDKTYADIVQLVDDGVEPIIKLTGSDGRISLYHLESINTSLALFQGVNNMNHETISIHANGKISTSYVKAVSSTTTINDKALSDNIVLTAEDVGATAAVLTSPNGTKYTITVDDEGVLHATPVSEEAQNE